MQINANKPLASYTKATQDGKLTRRSTKPSWKVLVTLLGVLVFVIGSISVVLITRRQDTTPVAPTAPTSEPAAYIEKAAICTLTFDVNPDTNLLSCGDAGCTNNDDCDGNLICVEAANGNNYCADRLYASACSASPSYINCCTPPTITTQPPTITTQPPTVTTQPPTITTTVTGTVTVTQPPVVTTQPPTQVTTVVTTVSCNDICSANADCRNISHICYEGRCRLDVNPTDAQCRLPSGETTITRPVVVPTESGPADWLNYLKAGLGVLGIGALLMLLL